MKRARIPYKVYRRRRVSVEPPDEDVVYPWIFAGSTFAVSEAQAINNVRHRMEGDYGTSQYLPREVSGHYEVWIDYKAVPD